MLSKVQLKEYEAKYNALLNDVDEAYKDLWKKRNRLKAIKEGLKIIKKHDANDYLGLFLLHRHFDCPSASVFVERRYTPNKGHAQVLVTKAEVLSTAPRRMYPHRFSFGADGMLQPLEFTTDLTAGKAFKRLAGDDKLQQELGKYIVECGMSVHLGVGIFQRTGAGGRATSVFLEETNFSNRTSVVHVLPQLPHEIGRTIPTLWTFGDRGQGCCSGQCVAYCSHGGTPGLGYCGHRKTGGHMVCV
jgi:hypothetical protein